MDASTINNHAVNSAPSAQGAAPFVVPSSTAPSPYIPTDANAVTVTDYTLSGLDATFSPVVADGVLASWSGSYTFNTGLDPTAMMRYSDDGGHSWSEERSKPIGKIGEKMQRVIWRRLGSSRNRVYELKISDPVPVTILGADLEAEGGAS